MSRPASLRVHPAGVNVAWMRRRACHGVPTDVFFPDTEYTYACIEAKKFCGSCDVAGDCLAYAMEHREKHGIWGGLSTAERRRLRRSHSLEIPDHDHECARLGIRPGTATTSR